MGQADAPPPAEAVAEAPVADSASLPESPPITAPATDGETAAEDDYSAIYGDEYNPVADPTLFSRYPPDDLVPGKGTVPPDDWSTTEFLTPVVESITD